MKILILILMCLFILPVFVMGESPPTVAPALKFEGLALDTIAVSFTQDAAFVLYDILAFERPFNLSAEADQYKMISSSVNAQKIERDFGITQMIENISITNIAPINVAITEPDIVLRL